LNARRSCGQECPLQSIDMNHVLLIFIDGLGIGKRDEHNPLAQIPDVAPLAVFQNEEPKIPFDGVLARTDACLGVEGRPQSASGQTTILTGINAPQKLGFHKQGFPNQALRDVISEKSIFLQLKQLDITPNTFANGYTPLFFAKTPRWKSATTCAMEAAQMRFRDWEDLLNNRALFHDFTNSVLLAQNAPGISLRTPEEAGKILANITAENCFTLYEYFITDKTGHDQDFELSKKILPDLAAFVRSAVKNVDLKKTTVMMTSDHGNIEDLSKRNHTLNEVPTVVWGRKAKETAVGIRSLADITPAIVNLLQND
jgi:2,3-bisphosphoglycerate-independent phosphoglycerate mutase